MKNTVRTCIVDHNVNPLGMLVLQEFAEGLYAFRLADIQLMELYGCLAAVLYQHFGFLQLWIIVQRVDSFRTSLS